MHEKFASKLTDESVMKGGGMRITFRVFGIPQTKGSAKGFVVPGKNGGRPRAIITNDNTKNKGWAQTVSAIAQQCRPLDGLWSGPVKVTLIFRMPIPKSLPKRQPAFMTKRPDIDKCTRSILDAIKGVIYSDDSQVVGLAVSKLYGTEPGVNVHVEQIDLHHEGAETYAYRPSACQAFMHHTQEEIEL